MVLSSAKSKINHKIFLRLIIGVVFLVSGISKLLGPENFINEIDKINFLGSAFTYTAAYGFILFELVLGTLRTFFMTSFLTNVK